MKTALHHLLENWKRGVAWSTIHDQLQRLANSLPPSTLDAESSSVRLVRPHTEIGSTQVDGMDPGSRVRRDPVSSREGSPPELVAERSQRRAVTDDSRRPQEELLFTRWHLYRFYRHGANTFPSESFAMALKSGLWSVEEALASAAHLVPSLRESAVTLCVQCVSSDELATICKCLREHGVGFDTTWSAVCVAYINAGDIESAREALAEIVGPEVRVDTLVELSSKLSRDALTSEVEAAWRMVWDATYPERIHAVEPLANLVSLLPPERRLARAQRLEQLVSALSEKDLDACGCCVDMRMLVARSLADAGDIDRSLRWIERLEPDDLSSRVAWLRCLPLDVRERIGNELLSRWNDGDSRGLVVEIAEACPALVEHCVEVFRREIEPSSHTQSLLELAPYLPVAALSTVLEEALHLIEELWDQDEDREDLIVAAITGIADRRDVPSALRERLHTLCVNQPTEWMAPRVARFLVGPQRDALWSWVTKAVDNDPIGWDTDGRLEWDLDDLTDAALTMWENASPLWREAHMEEAKWFATRVLPTMRGSAGNIPKLCSWLPLVQQRSIARERLCRDRTAHWNTTELLDELSTLASQEEDPQLRELVGELIRASGREEVGPALSSPASRAQSPHGPVSRSADTRPSDELDGDRTALIAGLPGLSPGRKAALILRLVRDAFAEELESIEGIALREDGFSTSTSHDVWRSIAWRWHALGDSVRAFERAQHSVFDRYRITLRYRIALAAADDARLAVALRELAALPYDPAIDFFPAVKQCVSEGRIQPVWCLLPELERSRRVVVCSLLLQSSSDHLPLADSTRERLTSELRTDLDAYWRGEEVPANRCLGYALLAVPRSDCAKLLDLALSLDAIEQEVERLGFSVSFVRIVYRLVGVEALRRLVGDESRLTTQR